MAWKQLFFLDEPAVSAVWLYHTSERERNTGRKWCRKRDLNPQPTAYKAVALPIEPFRHIFRWI